MGMYLYVAYDKELGEIYSCVTSSFKVFVTNLQTLLDELNSEEYFIQEVEIKKTPSSENMKGELEIYDKYTDSDLDSNRVLSHELIVRVYYLIRNKVNTFT